MYDVTSLTLKHRRGRREFFLPSRLADSRCSLRPCDGSGCGDCNRAIADFRVEVEAVTETKSEERKSNGRNRMTRPWFVGTWPGKFFEVTSKHPAAGAGWVPST